MSKEVRVRIRSKIATEGAENYADLPFSNDDISGYGYLRERANEQANDNPLAVDARCVIGIVWDTCTEAISAAIVRDVMTIASSVLVPMTIVLQATNESTLKRLRSLSQASGKYPIDVVVDASATSRKDVNAWLRYWIEKKPTLAFDPDIVVDRDYAKPNELPTDQQNRMSDRVVIPTGPRNPHGRGIGPSSNPLLLPPGNPLLPPTFNYASRRR